MFDVENFFEEALFGAIAVIEEERGDDTEPEMISKDDSDVGVGVDEANESGTPADGWGNVEECEDSYLEYNKPEENHVDELYHVLVDNDN